MERRDELSAHTFARKRTLAAFLQPESRVSDEEAPRPVRAMMPGTVMSLVLVVGCIAWGAIAPSAPPGWDKTGEYIIVDTDSTTRYVVLPAEGKDGKKTKQLHPVLNYASAKLVLDKGKGEVIEVAGKDIDASGISRGATIGIPYAPDRLPSPEDAEAAKEWAVCQKPSQGGEPQQAVFVLGGQDKDALQNKSRLGDGEALYVQDSETGAQYIVDGEGTKLLLDNASDPEGLLTSLVLRDPGEPQQVSSEWLDTLLPGEPLSVPSPEGAGAPAQFDGVEQLPEEARAVGTVLEANPGGAPYYYVVGVDGLQRVSPLYAALMRGGQGQGDPVPVSQRDATAAGADLDVDRGGKGWPKEVLRHVNRAAQGIGGSSRTVSCSVYTGAMTGEGPELAAWAGSAYPAKVVAGTASAYVSSGSGLLYQEVSGSTGGGGGKFLLTDSGLRHGVDTKASARLGYEKTKAALVPQNWSQLLPKGPKLDTDNASQEQGF
ncbi:type VII secretion protein EccB [Streptomyces sp. DSM 42041]|uniref:Type VII secretion protein EccB n=1 Tax=Streptomyces hazeniae TaxID=3075538 RepID=A0ABU2NPW7_9ACTN|nr:type VII secretion protein EccB [Streptomyces sp. DSM 42041]MDT0378820.1 type VII secretion protein EccB [Streptomyces sp. DSM 42041]